VEDVRVEGLAVDGNKDTNDRLNGCRGGGIYLHRAKRCQVVNCVVRDFNGDGISFQITQDILVEGCECTGCTGLGMHPGTGSARPIVRRNRIHHNGDIGLFLCWRVQDGLFEENEIYENGGAGISIGHKDSRNTFVRNVIRKNRRAGIHFRPENEKNAGHECRFAGNIIEDNGEAGILVDGAVHGLEFTENIVRSTLPAGQAVQKIGIYIGPQAQMISLLGNKVSGHPDGDIVEAPKAR
jgi:nitrous oxidase accessory protein NosD